MFGGDKVDRTLSTNRGRRHGKKLRWIVEESTTNCLLLPCPNLPQVQRGGLSVGKACLVQVQRHETTAVGDHLALKHGQSRMLESIASLLPRSVPATVVAPGLLETGCGQALVRREKKAAICAHTGSPYSNAASTSSMSAPPSSVASMESGVCPPSHP